MPISVRSLLPVVALALAAAWPSSASALPADCEPPGSVVVGGPVIRWQGTWWQCTRNPRRLVPLPVHPRTRDVRHIVARGEWLAFAYYLDSHCDNYGNGAMSVNRRTGAIRYELAYAYDCIDVYTPYISDIALRPDTGAFAVIRVVEDLEDDQGDARVIGVNGSGAKVLDWQPQRGPNDGLYRHRILPSSLSYKGHRLHWRHAHGPQTARI
jgi:hypothetical protein